jgi:hypothetical protein
MKKEPIEGHPQTLCAATETGASIICKQLCIWHNNKKNAPDASNHHETSSNIMLPNSSPLWLGTKLMDTVCRVLKGFAGELYALGDLRKQRQTLHSCVFEEPLADKEAPLSSPTFPKKQVGGILPTILDFPPRILFKRIRASQLMTCLEVQVPCLKGDLFRYSLTRFIGCVFRRRTKFPTVILTPIKLQSECEENSFTEHCYGSD